MTALFDMTMLADKSIRRAMARLPGEVQKKVMRREVRRSGLRLHTELLLNLSGRVLDEDTGRMIAAFEGQTVRTKLQSDGTVVASIKIPTQPEMGMPRPGRTEDVDHPATIQEYGQPGQPPRPFMRKAVDDNADREHERIAVGLGNGVTREWERLTRR